MNILKTNRTLENLSKEIEVIKNLPNLLNAPILVLDSKTVPGRLVPLGEHQAKGVNIG